MNKRERILKRLLGVKYGDYSNVYFVLFSRMKTSLLMYIDAMKDSLEGVGI